MAATSRLELRLPGDEVLIFDAGSGVRALGLELCGGEDQAPQPIHIFLTHFHWDHIGGIPFFDPLYNPAQQIAFYGSGQVGWLRPILEGQMVSPYFPVDMWLASAGKEFHELESAGRVEIGTARIYPFRLNHPQGALGYRVETGGAVLVYATDFEHGDEFLDRTLREYAEGADILICDSQYTPEEYEQHTGWGHSTWLEATHIATDVRAKCLFLFHHDPARTDDQLDAVVGQARTCFEQTNAAQEGMLLEQPASTTGS
jgi:phosphoribosyl 1,2-cyclic phosphodiesterase